MRIFQSDIRQKAISGAFTPECTRWVLSFVSGDYAGWFALSWGKADDLYRAAKRIKGSRYAAPYVAVPPEQFEEVLDFAHVYDFRLNTGAREIAEQAKARRDAVLIVKVERAPRRNKIKPADTPQLLAVPQDVAVLDEFREVI